MQVRNGVRTWHQEQVQPRKRVPVQYVPQLQLHMLAAGLPSALFVSRTSDCGTNFFRVPRDDECCSLMLMLISRFHTEFSGRRPWPRAPKLDACKRWPEWKRLCAATKRISAASRVLHHLPAAQAPMGQAQPFYV